MNSRERLLKVLNCKMPDRVPISTYELVGFNSKSFENNDPSYANLMQTIRNKTDCICMWNPDSNSIFLGSSYPVKFDKKKYKTNETEIYKKIIYNPEGNLTQIIKKKAGIHTGWKTEHWCKTIEDVDRALSIPYQPVKYDFSDYARITEEVGNNGIIMSSLSDPLFLGMDLMEFGMSTVWALQETEHFAKTIKILHKRNMENIERMLQKQTVDLYRICGPEYATPPFLPPVFFERFVTPYVSEMVDLIHKYGCMVRFHCHGNINRVLHLIKKTGVDGIDPCEAPPDGDIELSEVKRRIGENMCIFGNIQLKLLENGTLKEVSETVRKCMDSAKENGGYVIMPTAAPINSPLTSKTERNYIHFIEESLVHGKY